MASNPQTPAPPPGFVPMGPRNPTGDPLAGVAGYDILGPVKDDFGTHVGDRIQQNLEGMTQIPEIISQAMGGEHKLSNIPRNIKKGVGGLLSDYLHNPSHAVGDLVTGGVTGELAGGLHEAAPAGAVSDIPAPIQAAAHEITAPPTQPFEGVHYAEGEVQGGRLLGSKRGSSALAGDADRIRLGDRGAPPAVHVYEHNAPPKFVHPDVVSRSNPYVVRGNYAIANVPDHPVWNEAYESALNRETARGTDPGTAHRLAANEAEWSLHDAGYHGYRNTSYPGNVTLFGDHPASAMGEELPSAPPPALRPGDTRGTIGTSADMAEGLDAAGRQPLPPAKPPQSVWPEQYRQTALDNTGTGGANYTSDELEAFKRKHGIGKHESDPAGVNDEKNKH